MGIREYLNKKPGLMIAIAAAACAGATMMLILSNRDVTQIRVSLAYYSIDDGKTYFSDKIDRIYPFSHDGKSAFRAYVYQCGNQPPFVSYLARYDESVREKLESLKGKTSPEAVEQYHELSTRIEVKKPGESKWVAMLSAEGQSLTMHPSCPDGSIAKGIFP